MTKPVLNQIWTFLAVAVLYLTINVWSATQQWQFSLPGNPFKEGKVTAHSVTLYGIPLCGILFITLLVVTRWYARADATLSWAARFPRLGNLDFDPNTSQARTAQTLSGLVFIGLPAAGLVHFLIKFLKGTAYQTNNKPFVSGLQHLTRWTSLSESFSGAFYYDRDSSVLRGPDFAPFWEPWLLTLWVAFVLTYTVVCLTPVFGPAAVKGRHHHRRH